MQILWKRLEGCDRLIGSRQKRAIGRLSLSAPTVLAYAVLPRQHSAFLCRRRLMLGACRLLLAISLDTGQPRALPWRRGLPQIWTGLCARRTKAREGNLVHRWDFLAQVVPSIDRQHRIQWTCRNLGPRSPPGSRHLAYGRRCISVENGRFPSLGLPQDQIRSFGYPKHQPPAIWCPTPDLEPTGERQNVRLLRKPSPGSMTKRHVGTTVVVNPAINLGVGYESWRVGRTLAAGTHLHSGALDSFP